MGADAELLGSFALLMECFEGRAVGTTGVSADEMRKINPKSLLIWQLTNLDELSSSVS